MIERIQEYLESFSSRNLFQDTHLETMVGEARQILGGVSPDSIRENYQLKNHIRDKMAMVKAEIDQALEDMPGRKIRFAA